MAQAILGAYLVERSPGFVVVIQYANDVLIVGRCPDQVRSQAAATHLSVGQARWVVSLKSRLEPTFTTQWMGKVVGGGGGVENAPSLQAHLICYWLRLAMTGYSAKALRRILGKVQWAVKPGRGAQPFLVGAYRWLFLGPLAAKCNPPPPRESYGAY